MKYNENFPVLSIVSKILWGLGAFLLIVGIISGIPLLIDFLELQSTAGAEWYWAKEDIFKIVLAITGILWGLLTMAFAEIVGVLFSIEKNTRS